MFSANKKVSVRQLKRITVTEDAAMAMLFAGYMAGLEPGLCYFWVMVAGMVLSMAYMWGAMAVAERYGDRLIKSKIFNLITCVRFFFMAVFGIYVFFRIVKYMLLSDTAGIIIMVGIWALCLMVGKRKYEERGRMHEILGIFALALILIILITASFKINLNDAVMDLSGGLKLPSSKAWKIWIIMFLTSGYYEKLIVISPHYYNSYSRRVKMLKVPVIIWLGALWVYVLCSNVFGKGASLFKLMDIGGIPGGFINRQEAVLAVFLIVSLTSYISGMFYYIRQNIKNIFTRYCKKPHIVTGKAVLLTVIILTVTLSIIWGVKADGTEAMAGGKAVGKREIEDWDFVMSMVIMPGEKDGNINVILETADVKEGGGAGKYTEYVMEGGNNQDIDIEYMENRHRREGQGNLDFSHIKGILFYGMDENAKNNAAEYLKQRTEFSGNIPVFEAYPSSYPNLRQELLGEKSGETENKKVQLGVMLEKISENLENNDDNRLYRYNRN